MLIRMIPGGSTSLDDRDQIARLLTRSGQVDTVGLRSRIRRAHLIAMAEVDRTCVGVAALKCPTHSYRIRLTSCSGVLLDEADYPFELGWVFVRTVFRGQHLGVVLCERLLEHAGRVSTFATIASNNSIAMMFSAHLGYIVAGNQFHGREGNLLSLFLRNVLDSAPSAGPPSE